MIRDGGVGYPQCKPHGVILWSCARRRSVTANFMLGSGGALCNVMWFGYSAEDLLIRGSHQTYSNRMHPQEVYKKPLVFSTLLHHELVVNTKLHSPLRAQSSPRAPSLFYPSLSSVVIMKRLTSNSPDVPGSCPLDTASGLEDHTPWYGRNLDQLLIHEMKEDNWDSLQIENPFYIVWSLIRPVPCVSC